MVTRVAIIEDGVLWAGNDKERHHHVIHRIYQQTQKTVKGEQGFLTDDGTFLTREEAALEALRCGQVVTGEANIQHVFNGYRLYSEDLW